MKFSFLCGQRYKSETVTKPIWNTMRGMIVIRRPARDRAVDHRPRTPGYPDPFCPVGLRAGFIGGIDRFPSET